MIVLVRTGARTSTGCRSLSGSLGFLARRAGREPAVALAAFLFSWLGAPQALQAEEEGPSVPPKLVKVEADGDGRGAADVPPEAAPSAAPAAAPAAAPKGVVSPGLDSPFAQGKFAVRGLLSWASAPETHWLSLGLGVGYFPLTGLELKLDGSAWLFGSSFVSSVGLGARYVFVMVPDIKPYVGAGFKHYTVDSSLSSDSIGASLGLLFPMGSSFYAGGGLNYEHFWDSNVLESHDQFFPEVSFSWAL